MSGENYHLIIRKGPKPGQIYPLLAPTITIGRDPMSDIALNDPEVSRYHAQLTQTDDGYQIQDMGSTNGTFVAGQRLGSETALLVPGQDVAFGSGITLSFEVVGSGEEAATFIETAPEPPQTAVPEMSSPPPAQSYTPEPPPQPAPPLVPAGDDDAARRKKRNMIIIAVIFVLLCCCCGFVVIAWNYGDWFMEQLGIQLSLPMFQSMLLA